MKEKALILLSGGQDSTTAAVWAIHNKYDLTAIIFDYGQRHKVEIKSAKTVARMLNVPFFVKKIRGVFPETSALINKKLEIKMDEEKKLPTSFVPGRNILFLTIAAAEAYARNIKVLITGVSQEDYSGYPDCRQETISALCQTLNLGMEYTISILTPWMFQTKTEEIFYLDFYHSLRILKYTHTCYNGVIGGCGKCPACIIRQAAFDKANIIDPLKERRWKRNGKKEITA
jgi:7-cyano-7-deazaguanine synthase